MRNRRLVSPALGSQLELVGSGLTFTPAMRAAFGSTVLFDGFSPADIHSISSYMHAYRAHMGATIFREGEPDGYLCVLAEGLVGAYRQDGAGGQRRLGSILPGEIFGTTALIEEQPHTASFIAEAKSVLLLLSRENFRLCVDRNPALGMRVLLKVAEMLSLRLRQSSAAPAELAG